MGELMALAMAVHSLALWWRSERVARLEIFRNYLLELLLMGRWHRDVRLADAAP